MKKCSPSHGQNGQLVCWWVLVPLFLHPVRVNKPWRDRWMDGWWDRWMHPVPNAQVWTLCLMHKCVYLTVHLPATPHLYFILFPPRRSKQTMMGRMDDRTNGRMDDGIDGWNDVSRCPLLCPLRRVCIPLFLRPVEINRPWWDGWMARQMDGWMTT